MFCLGPKRKDRFCQLIYDMSDYFNVGSEQSMGWILRSLETQHTEVFEMLCLQAIRYVFRADTLQNINIVEDNIIPESITDTITRRRFRCFFGHVCRMQKIHR